MAACDYRSCDVCGGKTFYDADLSYENAKQRDDPESFRIAGCAQPFGAILYDLGDWAVICRRCSETHRTAIVPIDPKGAPHER